MDLRTVLTSISICNNLRTGAGKKLMFMILKLYIRRTIFKHISPDQRWKIRPLRPRKTVFGWILPTKFIVHPWSTCGPHNTINPGKLDSWLSVWTRFFTEAWSSVIAQKSDYVTQVLHCQLRRFLGNSVKPEVAAAIEYITNWSSNHNREHPSESISQKQLIYTLGLLQIRHTMSSKQNRLQLSWRWAALYHLSVF